MNTNRISEMQDCLLSQNVSSFEKALNLVSVDGLSVYEIGFDESCGFVFPPLRNALAFNKILSKPVTIVLNSTTLVLGRGDIIIMPKIEGYSLFGGLDISSSAISQLPKDVLPGSYQTIQCGSKPGVMNVVSGVVPFSHPLMERLTGLLPDFIIIRKEDEESYSYLDTLIKLIHKEFVDSGVGKLTVSTKLVDVLVIEVIRKALEIQRDYPWLMEVESGRLFKIVQLIQNQPERKWTLDCLAKEACMSRTSFSTKFKKLFNRSPMKYLRDWRLSFAYSELLISKDSVYSIGVKAGYNSEAAFSRAFKEYTNSTPAAVRNSATSVT